MTVAGLETLPRGGAAVPAALYAGSERRTQASRLRHGSRYGRRHEGVPCHNVAQPSRRRCMPRRNGARRPDACATEAGGAAGQETRATTWRSRPGGVVCRDGTGHAGETPAPQRREGQRVRRHVPRGGAAVPAALYVGTEPTHAGEPPAPRQQARAAESAPRRHAGRRSVLEKGSDRMRWRVAAKRALQIAGRAGGRAGSPRPVGECSVFRKWTSTSGASAMRSSG